MSRQGQLTQKGINAQNWAAMSLFLQYVTQQDFRYIGFEGKKLEDFHLVFEDTRKIICESKASLINLANIRNILDKIIKHGQVTDRDEILIVCKDVNKNAKRLIENFKYFTEDIKKKLKNKKHRFEDKHLKLLPQLKFWEVSQEINRQAVEILMAKVLSYPEPFWIPKHRLQELTKSLVEDKVYKGSQKGEILTKDDFLKLLESEKVQILEDDGYDYEQVKKTKEKEVKKIINSIKAKTKKLNINNEIIKLYVNPSIHHFALQKLANEKDLKLFDWENLWKATYQSAFSIELFKIFENNIQNKENQKFALGFIFNTIGGATNYFREEFIKYDIVKLCKKVLEFNPSLEEKIFEIIKKVYKHSIDKFLYVKRRRDDIWEREKTAELLKEIYEKSDNEKLKNGIIDYIVTNFNVVKDDGRFWRYTPPSVFKILGKHVSTKPEERILWFTKKCVEQYDKFYRTFGKRLKFSGWEYMGSGISQSGSSFSITDRYFVTQVLTPSLKKLYDTDKKKGLNFILKECLSLKGVTRDRPDFLNRATLPILLDEYKNREFNEEIFGILKAFIKMRKGIPWKNDFIFQALRSNEFTNKQKWKLVKVSLNEYNNLPVNVFVEQIVFDLVSKNHEEASQMVTEWVKNTEYNARHLIGSYGPTDGVLKLLENNFDSGVNFLKNYLLTDDFIKKTNTFDTYNVAKAVAKVLEADTKIGLEILEEIYRSERLTTNQQICISSGIYNVSGDEKATLLKIHKQFLWPKLSSLLGLKAQELKNLAEEDIKPIKNRFSYASARESLVEFAEKLASNRSFKDALNIVRIFIHDSDPPIDGSCERHQDLIKGKDSYAIGTVRGRCAWVLQKFANLYGRKHINEVVSFVEKLSKDKNYYIRLEACIPLIELVKIRHTHSPDEPKERFIPNKLAAEIENIAFNMLFDSKNQEIKEIMRYLAMTFSYMRTLGTDDAKKVLETFLNSEFDEVATEITPLLVYYALFRKESFKNWPWKKLDKFDPDEFKKLFKKQLKEGRPAIRAKLAWQLERLPDEIKNTPEEKRSLSLSDAVKLSTKYLLKLTDKYDHDVLNDIYRFIEEYIDDYFDLCFKLWTKCIETESKYFEDNWSEDKLHEMYWWSFFYNGKVLVTILDNKDAEEFLTWFEKLANYPIKVLIANDLDVAVEKLVEIKNYKQRVKDLFDLLIKRNPKYYDFKQRWLKGKKDE